MKLNKTAMKQLSSSKTVVFELTPHVAGGQGLDRRTRVEGLDRRTRLERRTR